MPEDVIPTTPPLRGVRILDLTRLLPGDTCTLMLADMGAEVIKVEDLRQGDYMRWMPPLLGRYGAYFHALNAGKKSVGVNLKTGAGHGVFLKVLGTCDVLVESFRPGVMDGLGLGYESLKKLHPRLIYCSLSGYGQSGPYRSRAGHDLNYEALTGLVPAPAEGAEPPPLPRAPVADIAGSYAAALSIVAALHGRFT